MIVSFASLKPILGGQCLSSCILCIFGAKLYAADVVCFVRGVVWCVSVVQWDGKEAVRLRHGACVYLRWICIVSIFLIIKRLFIFLICVKFKISVDACFVVVLSLVS